MKLLNMKTLKLFGICIVVSFLIGLLLTKILPPYKMGIPMSTDAHQTVFYLFLSVVFLYSGIICLLLLEHRLIFKFIMVPVILFISLVIGVVLHNSVLTPLIVSIPVLYAGIDNWIFNLQWFMPFSISCVVPIIFYIEWVFFKWVRAGNQDNK